MAGVSATTKQKIAELFYDCGLLRFGEFKTKSGMMSPFYIDLRKAQSYPEIFHAIVDAYSEMITELDSGVLLAGVPEAATPLATAVGYKMNRSLIQPRKVVKEYGAKHSVEGVYKEGDTVVLIDDMITKGDSKIEVIKQVESVGLVVQELIILVDREQGGIETVEKAGYSIQAAFTITELLDALLELKKINSKQRNEMIDFVRNN